MHKSQASPWIRPLQVSLCLYVRHALKIIVCSQWGRATAMVIIVGQNHTLLRCRAVSRRTLMCYVLALLHRTWCTHYCASVEWNWIDAADNKRMAMDHEPFGAFHCMRACVYVHVCSIGCCWGVEGGSG